MTVGENRAPVVKAASMTLPVLMKEMRSRMRGMRGPVLLFIATGLTILVGLIVLGMGWENVNSGYYDGSYYGSYAQRMAELGRVLFISLTILEAILTALISPALTAGAISIEREQQTLDLLLLTRLSSANIILGKLLSSLGFLLIVLLCSLPVLAICFILGGVSPLQLLGGLVLILAVVILFGAFGLYCSARFQRTATSVAVAYSLCIAWLGLVPLAIWLLENFSLQRALAFDAIDAALMLIGIIFIFSVLPAILVSALCGSIRRRRLSWVSNFAIWGIFAALLLLVMLFADNFHSLSLSEYFLIGNPIMAFVGLFEPEELTSQFNEFFVYYLLLPVTLAWHLLVAGAMTILAVRRLNRLRQAE